MIIRATLPANSRVLPLEVEGSLLEIIPHRYANDVRLKLRFTFPEEREEEIRKRGLRVLPGYDEKERKRLVVSFAEVPAENCEILKANLQELTELRKYCEVKNSKEMWIDAELADIRKNMRG